MAYGTIGREVALEERMAVERDHRLMRTLSAVSPPEGGLLTSQLGSAGQWAKVRPRRAWEGAKNSEKEEPWRGHGSDDEMTE